MNIEEGKKVHERRGIAEVAKYFKNPAFLSALFKKIGTT